MMMMAVVRVNYCSCLQSFCASFGANLASVHSIWEYEFLQRLLKTGGHSFGWIGGYYFEVCSTKTATKRALM